jgi:hypothetical protein
MARRQAVKREERVGATLQTLAKLKPDPIMVWRQLWDAHEGKRGGLSLDDEDAIMGIRRAYGIITGPVHCKLAAWVRMDRSYESDQWPKEIRDLIKHFNDWADRMGSVIQALDNIIDDGDGWMPNYDVVKEACAVWESVAS